MPIASYNKLDIAYEYLETAIRLFVEDRDYFSATHLAAAAEELFGRHLPKDDRISVVALKAQIALQVMEGDKEVDYSAAHDTGGEQYKKAKQVVVWEKNEIKHMNDDRTNATVAIDPIDEAREWIEFAIINYEKVKTLLVYWGGIIKSPTMWKFEGYRGRDCSET
jgi:hypothetical protein